MSVPNGRDALALLLLGTIDLVVTDPAYESLEKHRAVGTTTRLKVSQGSSNPWFPVFPNVRFGELFEQSYEQMASDAFSAAVVPIGAFVEPDEDDLSVGEHRR